jgi:hypothetical protein
MVQTRSAAARLAAQASQPATPRKKKATKPKNKKLMSAGKAKSHQLTSFHCFEKLPTELRAMIWKMTLVPRAVDIQFTTERGFYSLTLTPIALRACPDSRSAVIHTYKTCFGSFFYQPKTIINFSIDTLYLHTNAANEITLFLSNLKPQESSSIQYIAMNKFANDHWFDGSGVETDAFEILKKAIPLLPALREVQLVLDIAMRLDDPYDEGTGAIRLYESWPDYIMEDHLEMVHFMRNHCSCGQCYDDGDFSDEEFDGSDCPCGEHDLPDPLEVDGYIGGIGPLPSKNVKLSSIWGWRPGALTRTPQF